MAQNDSFKGGGGTIDTPVGAQWPSASAATPGSTEFGRATAAGSLDVTARGETLDAKPFETTGIETTGADSDNHQRTGREVVVAERARTRPSTAAVIGSAVAGAVAGGVIPFMLAGRKSGERSVLPHGSSEPFERDDLTTSRTGRWGRSWQS